MWFFVVGLLFMETVSFIRWMLPSVDNGFIIRWHTTFQFESTMMRMKVMVMMLLMLMVMMLSMVLILMVTMFSSYTRCLRHTSFHFESTTSRQRHSIFSGDWNLFCSWLFLSSFLLLCPLIFKHNILINYFCKYGNLFLTLASFFKAGENDLYPRETLRFKTKCQNLFSRTFISFPISWKRKGIRIGNSPKLLLTSSKKGQSDLFSDDL